MGINQEQVPLFLTEQLQRAFTLSKHYLAKGLNDCLSSLHTWPHIEIVRKFRKIVKSYQSGRQQKQKMLRPITSPLEIETYTDVSYTERATMGQAGIIHQNYSASMAVFQRSSKTVFSTKNDVSEPKLDASKHANDEIVLEESSNPQHWPLTDIYDI